MEKEQKEYRLILKESEDPKVENHRL